MMDTYTFELSKGTETAIKNSDNLHMINYQVIRIINYTKVIFSNRILQFLSFDCSDSLS